YEEARAVLEPVISSAPHMALAMREFGLALIGLGERENGIDALLRAVDLHYTDKSGWFWLGEYLQFEDTAANMEGSPDASDSRIAEARSAYGEGLFKDAEAILRDVIAALDIAASPENGAALKLLGEVLLRMGRWREARPLLERSVELMPDSAAARFRCATMLFAFGHFEAALPHIHALVSRDADSRLYRQLKMVCLSRARQHEDAFAEFQASIEDYPDRPGLWTEYARLLKSE